MSIQYLNQYQLSPEDISVTYTSTHTYSSSISDSLYQSWGMCYQTYNAMGKNSPMTTTTSSVGVTMISQPILTLIQQNFNKITTTTTFSYILSTTLFTFPVENLGHAVSKPQDQKRDSCRTRKRTHQSCECHIMLT